MSEFENLSAQDSRSWAERNGIAPWVMALIWIVLAFGLFQLTATIAAFVAIAASGQSFDFSIVDRLYTDFIAQLVLGNSIGQLSMLALGTILITGVVRGNLSRGAFLGLRWNSKTALWIVFSALFVVFAQPIVWFLGWLNALIPLPESLVSLEASQNALIETYLLSTTPLWLLIANIALVPAISEELLFRGFALRLVHKSWGVLTAILVTGCIFGLYHFRLSQFIPLSVLGMVFAWITIQSNSLLPAMIAHFVNNAGSVVAARLYPEFIFETTMETMPPIWTLLISIVGSGFLVYYITQRTQTSSEVASS